MAGPFTAPVAISVPMENRDVRDNDFKALNLQDGVEEIDFRRETKEPTGISDRLDSYFTLDPVARTFTITPTGAAFQIFSRGEEFIISSPQTISIPAFCGTWYFYFVGDVLTISDTAWGFEDPIVFVAMLYCDTLNQMPLFLLDERHGIVMDWATHKRMHLVIGAEIGKEHFRPYNYLVREDGSLNSHCEIAFEGGTVYDEDIDCDIIDGDRLDLYDHTQYFTQKLSMQAQIPIVYKLGLEDNPTWHIYTGSNAPLYNDGLNTPFYNYNNNGIWELRNITENNYIAQIIVITTNVFYPMMCLLAQYESEAAADAAINISMKEMTEGLPLAESKPIEYLIYQANSSYGNDYKARLIEVVSAGQLKVFKDRYSVLCFYGGQALTGRVLEFGGGDDSEDQPLLIPEDSYVRTVTFQASADIKVGTKVGFFTSLDLLIPVFEVVVVEPDLTEHIYAVSEHFSEGAQLSVRITNDSVSKPVVRFWIETINI